MNSRTNDSGELPAHCSTPAPSVDRALVTKARTIWANIQTSRRSRSLSTRRAASSSKTPRASRRAPSALPRNMTAFCSDGRRFVVTRPTDARSASSDGAKSRVGKSRSKARRVSSRRFAAAPSRVAFTSRSS